MDAIQLLEHHHRDAEKLFEKLSAKKRPRNAEAIANELGLKLLAHMVIEQTQFYPAVREAAEDAIHEAYEEHHVARTQIERMLATDAKDETFPAKVKALKELIEHHVKEEEDELFPKVKKAIEAADLKALGVAMKKEFDVLLKRRVRTVADRADDADVLAQALP